MKKYTLFYWMVPILIAVLVGCTTTKAKKVNGTAGDSRDEQTELEESRRKHEKEVAA